MEQRQSQPSAGISMVDRMYPQFSKVIEQYSSHVVFSEHLSISEVAKEISKRIDTGESLTKE